MDHSGLTITKHSNIIEPSSYQLYYIDDDIVDIADISGKTPFDDLCSKEEREVLRGNEEHREAQVEAISAVLSYLFKKTRKGEYPTPRETALRLWILVHTIKPELLCVSTLAEIGKLFNTTGQNISHRLIEQNEETNLRARNRKAEHTRQTYSNIRKMKLKTR
jgi:hypothetical protein